MFKTELHLHSAEVSDCGTVYADEIADIYAENGYSTVVLTNHMSQYTFRSKKNGAREDMTWDEKIDFYLAGYNALVEAAKGRFNVLLGMELRFYDTLNDYLVYGIDENFLRLNGDIMALKTAKNFRPLVDENNLLFYQAHPFRNAMEITPPKYLDGIEICNGHSRHDSRNDFAKLWADRYTLLRTSGTDFHHNDQTPKWGMLTEFEIKDNKTLVETLRNGNFELLLGE